MFLIKRTRGEGLRQKNQVRWDTDCNWEKNSKHTRKSQSSSRWSLISFSQPTRIVLLSSLLTRQVCYRSIFSLHLQNSKDMKQCTKLGLPLKHFALNEYKQMNQEVPFFSFSRISLNHAILTFVSYNRKLNPNRAQRGCTFKIKTHETTSNCNFSTSICIF